MPLISAIIPTYNRAEMLREAIDSVLAQTFTDFELIVVDDGSTDDTARTAEAYGRRVDYIYQAHQGVSAARNLGLARARGRYIAYLDSDDLWQPRKLELQQEWMRLNPQARICYTDEIWIRRGVRVNPRNKHAKYSGDIFLQCLPLCIISPSSALMARELFEEVGLWDEALPAAEDYDLWLRIAARHNIFFIPELLIIKRGGHAGQLSQSIPALDRYRIQALAKLLDYDLTMGEKREAAVRELKRKCRIYVAGAFKRGKKDEAEYYQTLSNKY